MKTKKNFLKKLTAGLLGFVMTLGVGAAGYAGAVTETHADGPYNKVTSAPTDWSGTYLLVYESSTTAGVAWTGVDAVSCNVAVTIDNGKISSKPTAAVELEIATMTGGYSIKVVGGTNDGKYIKGTSNSNALGFQASAQLNTISYDSTNKGVLITSNTSVMRYNPANSNYRFRYFKSSTYSSQKIVQLYKQTAASFNVTYDKNGATSGSVPTDATAYNSGATVTVKGNTGNLKKTGYTFDGWYSNTSGTGGTAYAVGSTFSITAATTLYAKWNKNTYTVTTDITNGSFTGNSSVSHGTAYSGTVKASTGYNLPATLTVTIGGTASSAYSYNPSTGAFSIAAANVTGNIVISATCPARAYNVVSNIANGSLDISSITHNTELEATITPNTGYHLPDAKEDITIYRTIPNEAKTEFTAFSYSATDGKITILASGVTGDFEINAACYKEFSLSASCTNGTVSPATTSDSKIRTGQTATFEFTANQNYFLPQSEEDDGIEVINASVSSYSVTNNVATLVINNPTGDVEVSCTCIMIADKDITVNMDNVTFTGDGEGVIQIGGEPVDVIIDAASNYRLPDENNFTVIGADASYVFSSNHKSVTITLSNCVDDVVISGSPIRLYTISSSITNGSCSPASGEVDEDSSWSGTISANSGYKRPSSITVKMGGSTLTQGTDYTYNSSTGAVSINSVTGIVSISASMVELAEADISVTGSGNYADKFTYSGASSLTEGSTAQITITPKTEGSDVYFIKSSDIHVDGASVVSYTDNVLTIGSLSVGVSSVDITVTPQLKAINGIVLKTQPTTKTYNIGVPFSTSGAVVYAQYNDGSEGTQNIVGSCYPVFYTGGVEDAAAMFKNGSHTVKFAYDDGDNTYLTSTAVSITVNKVSHPGTVTFTKVAPQAGSLLIATKDSSDNWYYLPTATASNAGPAKETLTMSNNLPVAPTNNPNDYMWTFAVSSGEYTITNSDNKYLSANNSNSGLRVNTTNDTWTISATANGYKMQETNNSRYCGVWVDGSDWRPYTSSSAANYKDTGENIVFFTRTENPGTHEYAGIVAELADPQHQFFAGQSVENSQLTVKKYYDDEVGTETLTNDQFEISGHTLVAGWNTITVSHSGKTDTLRVYATERTGELVDAKIVASSGYQTTYWLDDEHSDWNLDNINLVAIYSDESEVSVSLQSLVDSGQVTINPAQPAEGVTSFTVSGSYDDGEKEVPINSDYNTVSGFTINNKVITQLNWAGRFDYSDHSFNVFEGSTINKNRFINSNKQSSYLKATFNDGTPAVDYSIDNCSVALYERDTEKNKNVFVKDVTFDQNGNYTFEAEDDGLYFLLSVGDAITQYSGAAVFHVCESLNAINMPGDNVKVTFTTSDFSPTLPTSAGGEATYTANEISFSSDGLYAYTGKNQDIAHIALPKTANAYFSSSAFPNDFVSIKITKSNQQSLNSASTIYFSKDGVSYDLSQKFNDATFTYAFDTHAKEGYRYFKVVTDGSNYTNIESIEVTYKGAQNIADSNFDAQTKVINFVKNNTISFGNWETVKANFNSTFTSSDTFAKNMFKYATAATGNDADCLQEFVNTYDSIARAYNLVDSTNNFLNRTLGSATAYTYGVEANGGSVSGGSSTSSTYNYGATITLPTTKTKTGYTFDGWYFDDAFTQPVGENPKTVTTFAMPAANTKVYAKWTEAKVNVSFSANGGAWEGVGTTKVVEVVEETYNQNYVLPETNPSKTGYNFVGWFTEEIGGTEITASTKFASATAITVYAHWTADKVNAAFNANGGAWTIDESTVQVVDVEQTFDSNYVLPPTNPEKEGYVFAGWFTQTTGGDPVTSSTVFNSAVAVNVYAHWSKIHSINFSGTNVNLDGETTFLSGEPYSATFEAEAGYLLPQTITVTVDGQPFSAYDYDPTDGSFSVTSMPEGDMSITITAFQGAYSITYYDGNGEKITTFDEKYYEYEYGVGLDELPTLGNKLGYRFAGWYDNPYYEGSAITSISADDSGAKTFYACWAFNAQSDLDQVTTSIGMSYTYAYRDENAQVSSSTVSSKAETKDGETSPAYLYEKVTSADDLTDGIYLIVYEAGEVAFNGALTTLDAVSNTVAIEIGTDGKIAGNETIDEATFTYNSSNGSFKGTGGKYFGNASNSNALTSSDSALSNTVSFDPNGNLDVKSSGGAYLRYNAASDQTRFRYYKSSSYTGQQAIQIYKQVSAGPTLTSIEIVGTPITTYYVGDTYVTTGLSVEATYDDGNTEPVEAEIRINKTTTAVASDTTLTFSASYGGKDASRDVPIKVDTEYHDVSFKFNFKNSGMDELVNTYKGVFKDMGLMVEYGGRERYFSFVPDAEDGNYYIYEYNKDGELEKTVTYKMKSGGVFTLSLGDVINNLDRANTEFTVCAYIVVGDEIYISTNSTTYSVVSWIEYYHDKKDYADAVQDLYDIFFPASSGNN